MGLLKHMYITGGWPKVNEISKITEYSDKCEFYSSDQTFKISIWDIPEVKNHIVTYTHDKIYEVNMIDTIPLWY